MRDERTDSVRRGWLFTGGEEESGMTENDWEGAAPAFVLELDESVCESLACVIA